MQASDARSFVSSTEPTRGSMAAGSSLESMNTWAAESTPVPLAGMCLTPFAASISARRRRILSRSGCWSKT
jgi:hypothetical protein